MLTLTDEEKDSLIKSINMCDGLIMQGEYDKFICNYAIDNDIQLMWICLGMQIIGKVDADKNNYIEDVVVKNKAKKNILVLIVNIIILKKVTSFKISAYSDDGLIEAIELPNKKIYKQKKYLLLIFYILCS